MNRKVIYCGNCGKKGHIYKNCHKPIMSIGIICISFKDININELVKKYRYLYNRYKNIEYLKDASIKKYINDNLKFLMVRRKHTIGFIEFVRGNYKFDTQKDLDYIKNIFSIMTKDEINFIKNNDFNSIWNHLWIRRDKNILYKKEYDYSNTKFEKLSNGVEIGEEKYSLSDFIDLDITCWTKTEIGFPKGRRNIKEKDVNCANREFQEETNLKEDEYSLIDIRPMNEIFKGSNGVNYIHRYYIGQANKEHELKVNKDNYYQNIEIGDIMWVSYEEGLNEIRDYSGEKKKILTKIYKILYFYLYTYLSKTV